MTEEKKREIVNSYLSGGTYATIRKQFGYAPNTIWKVLSEVGVCKGRGNNQTLAITDEQILQEIKDGLTRQEIADKYGTHVENLAKRMKRLGVHARYADNYCIPPNTGKGFGECWHYIEAHDAKVRECQSDFTYIESRRTNGTYIRVKCKYCGAIITKSDFNRCWKCECYSERKKQEETLQKKRADLVRLLIAVAESKKAKTCFECGKTFYSQYKMTAYCSETCKRRAKKKRFEERHPEKKKQHQHARRYIQRAKKHGCVWESGITRISVVKRDNNICQICGKVCNPHDKTWGSYGPDYPTLDHIIPLAKGGSHTWSNVQCACGYCNSAKRDLLTVKREEAWT